MLLVDKEIKKLLLPKDFFGEPTPPYIRNGESTCITNIGYDLRADCFMTQEGKALSEITLSPGESIFVASMEILGFDSYTVGKVALKNSRIRMGLTMDAPVYQPGHVNTHIYFRLTNVSSNEITLKQGEEYATLLFEQLSEAPDSPYSGTFQGELDFKNLADYKSKYLDQIQSIAGKVKDIKSLEKQVYGNVITILTIFIAIFSILNVNIGLIQSAISGWEFLAYNLIVLGAIGFLAALMKEFIPSAESKRFPLWLITLLCFGASVVIFLFVL